MNPLDILIHFIAIVALLSIAVSCIELAVVLWQTRGKHKHHGHRNF